MHYLLYLICLDALLLRFYAGSARPKARMEDTGESLEMVLLGMNGSIVAAAESSLDGDGEQLDDINVVFNVAHILGCRNSSAFEFICFAVY